MPRRRKRQRRLPRGCARSGSSSCAATSPTPIRARRSTRSGSRSSRSWSPTGRSRCWTCARSPSATRATSTAPGTCRTGSSGPSPTISAPSRSRWSRSARPDRARRPPRVSWRRPASMPVPCSAAVSRTGRSAAVRRCISAAVAAELREIVPPETALAFPAMNALRPHYTDEAAFVERVDDVQRAEGYRLVGVFEDELAHALAVAGFRVGHMLAWGRFLYVDDLSTLPGARRRGYGRQLLDWLGEEAERLGCD